MLKLKDAKYVKQSSETGSSSLVTTSVAGRDQGVVIGPDSRCNTPKIHTTSHRFRECYSRDETQGLLKMNVNSNHCLEN